MSSLNPGRLIPDAIVGTDIGEVLSMRKEW
jgi:hypothetical protein